MTSAAVVAQNLVQKRTVSVIICAYTHERWENLKSSIQSAQGQVPPVTEVIVVIDRNSLLEADVRAEFRDIVVAANQHAKGLSGARNTGIEIASGEILVFLDDDATAAPYCVAHMVKHVGSGIVGVTARVMPVWSSPKPEWFPDEFLWTVGCTHHENDRGTVRNLLGAGMCLTRDVFEAVGGFDCSVGRTRSIVPMGGEETELCMRATANMPDAKFFFEPRAVVYHTVTAQRVTWKYFALRCFAEGVTKAYLRLIVRANSSLAVEANYVGSILTRAIVRDTGSALAGDFGALKRIFAIMLGLGCAATGFAYGLCSRMFAKRPAAQTPGKKPAAEELTQGAHSENV